MSKIKDRADRITDYVTKNEGRTVDQVILALNITRDQLKNARKLNGGKVKSVRRQHHQVALYLVGTVVAKITPVHRQYVQTDKQLKRHIWYLTIEKPRNAELRLARLENRPPRLVMFPKRVAKEKTAICALQFEPRTKPLPVHPPIRTVWQPVAAWEMAA